MTRFLSFIGAIAILAALAAAGYFFSGLYNVAASQPDYNFVAKALERVRNASISQHATDVPPSGMEEPAAIQAGARAYLARGCTTCHGGPGVNWAKFSEGLRPDPPDLKEAVRDLTAAQIFWVVKNGINMTGMPSFAAADVPDEEIWKIAAFAKKLPDVSEGDFKAWTAPDVAATGDATAPK